MKYEGKFQDPPAWARGVARWVLQGRFGDIDSSNDETLETAIARCILENREQAADTAVRKWSEA